MSNQNLHYRISNTDGLKGAAWGVTYATRGEAQAALMGALGWSEVHLSDSYVAHDEGGCKAWSAYDSEFERDEDDTYGDAGAPVILEVSDEACPGCGCLPGEGKTPNCKDPMGCGYNGLAVL